MKSKYLQQFLLLLSVGTVFSSQASSCLSNNIDQAIVLISQLATPKKELVRDPRVVLRELKSLLECEPSCTEIYRALCQIEHKSNREALVALGQLINHLPQEVQNDDRVRKIFDDSKKMSYQVRMAALYARYL